MFCIKKCTLVEELKMLILSILFISFLTFILCEVNGKKFLVKTGDEEFETEDEDFETEDEDMENKIERYLQQSSPINVTNQISNW